MSKYHLYRLEREAAGILRRTLSQRAQRREICQNETGGGPRSRQSRRSWRKRLRESQDQERGSENSGRANKESTVPGAYSDPGHPQIRPGKIHSRVLWQPWSSRRPGRSLSRRAVCTGLPNHTPARWPRPPASSGPGPFPRTESPAGPLSRANRTCRTADWDQVGLPLRLGLDLRLPPGSAAPATLT